MDTLDTIKVPRVIGNSKTWFPLVGGESYRNVGMQSEVGYSNSEVAPTAFKGEQVLQNGTIEANGRNVFILQDAYFSYEFMVIG